VYLKIKDCQRI